MGVSRGFVRQVVQQYNREGEAAITTPSKGGRRNCYLSWSQEQQLIESFKAKARMWAYRYRYRNQTCLRAENWASSA